MTARTATVFINRHDSLLLLVELGQRLEVPNVNSKWRLVKGRGVRGQASVIYLTERQADSTVLKHGKY